MLGCIINFARAPLVASVIFHECLNEAILKPEVSETNDVRHRANVIANDSESTRLHATLEEPNAFSRESILKISSTSRLNGCKSATTDQKNKRKKEKKR